MKNRFLTAVLCIFVLFVSGCAAAQPADMKTAVAKQLSGQVTDSDQLEVIAGFAEENGLSATQAVTIYRNASVIIFSEEFFLGLPERKAEIISLATDGLTEEEIREWAKDKLFAEGFAEEKLKSLANMGWSPIVVYVMTEDRIQMIFDSVNRANGPGGPQSMLRYEALADEIFDDYKNGAVTYNNEFAQPPEDFIFPEIIRWDKYKFRQNEMGYFGVFIHSADKKYVMAITVDDTVYVNMDGSVRDDDPFVKQVAFYPASDME